MGKGVLGLGCSFMWGEGLYFYSELDDLPFGKYHKYDPELLSHGMVEYKNKYRFIRKVSDYYDTWNTTLHSNGSTNDYNLKVLHDVVHDNSIVHPDFSYNLNINDYSLLIFQFTSIYRSDSDITKLLLELDELFLELEARNIKICTLLWMEEFFNNKIYQERFLNRHVMVYVDNYKDNYFEQFIHDDSLNITVKSDFINDNLQINDLHLNHKGNQCFADSIIKKLEQDNFKI